MGPPSGTQTFANPSFSERSAILVEYFTGQLGSIEIPKECFPSREDHQNLRASVNHSIRIAREIKIIIDPTYAGKRPNQ